MLLLMLLLLLMLVHFQGLRVKEVRLLVELSHLVHMIELVDLIHTAHLIHLVHLMQLIDLLELLQCRVVVHTRLDSSSRCLSCYNMLLVSATRVGVVVNARVSGQFVGPAESFRTAGKLTGMRFLASVRSDVARLMLEPVKRLVA